MALKHKFLFFFLGSFVRRYGRFIRQRIRWPIGCHFHSLNFARKVSTCTHQRRLSSKVSNKLGMQTLNVIRNFNTTYHYLIISLEEPNGSKREEVGMVVNPGTPEEELVVMGTYSVYDDKTETETITMYTADKDGYKSRYMIRNNKLSPGSLKSVAG